MVKKSLRQFTLMATATVTLLLGRCRCGANGGRTANTCRLERQSEGRLGVALINREEFQLTLSRGKPLRCAAPVK